ncbi:transposase [Streptomyces sp. NPDC095613]|uniref:transposase n=1 Tax=Streptomyces sp. NPDC095613 TaxID=3155540 RepID=UPI00332B6587
MHHARRVHRLGAELREFNGERDHVHLLVHYPPKTAASRLVGLPQGPLRPAPAAGVPRPHPHVPAG